MKNEFSPPSSDRGVVNTTGPIFREKNVVIDWFEFTIKDNISPLWLFNDYFKIDSSEILCESRGLYSYNNMISYRDIKCYYHDERKDMGIHYILSGKGCRDFEDFNFDWLDFFQFLNDNFDINYTRIDVAIDTFTNRFYDMQKLRDYICNGQVVSKFKSSTEFIQKSLSSSLIESETIWFGSRTSDIQIVFYNKLFERKNLSYEVDDNIRYWYRCETRFRNDRARTLVECFLLNENYMNVINEVLYNYLDFKDYNYCESNKSRWKTSKWWLDFLETNKKLSLQINIKESSISRKKTWLNDSVSKTELLVYLSNLSLSNDYSIDKYSISYLYDLLKEGSKKVTSKDLLLVNEHRVKSGLIPLSKKDLIDMLSNLVKLAI